MATIARVRRRVIMSDVDAVQVHFAAHYRWFDAAFHELMAELGHPLAGVIAAGHGTPVVDSHCSYLAPVTIDQAIEITAQVRRVGATSFGVGYEIRRGETMIANGETTHVWVQLNDGNATSMKAPDWLRKEVA